MRAHLRAVFEDVERIRAVPVRRNVVVRSNHRSPTVVIWLRNV